MSARPSAQAESRYTETSSAYCSVRSGVCRTLHRYCSKLVSCWTHPCTLARDRFTIPVDATNTAAGAILTLAVCSFFGNVTESFIYRMHIIFDLNLVPYRKPRHCYYVFRLIPSPWRCRRRISDHRVTERAPRLEPPLWNSNYTPQNHLGDDYPRRKHALHSSRS